MALYKKTKDRSGAIQDMIQRTTDKAFIPFDNGNTDYQDYKKWLDEGNTPEAAD